MKGPLADTRASFNEFSKAFCKGFGIRADGVINGVLSLLQMKHFFQKLLNKIPDLQFYKNSRFSETSIFMIWLFLDSYIHLKCLHHLTFSY